MQVISFLIAVVALAQQAVTAAGVKGTPEGFASGATGGGSTAPVTPTTNDELVKYLGDSQPRVILITKTFDFTNAEGTATEPGCAPWGNGAKCQLAINANGWCDNYQKGAKVASITYNKAGTTPIKVASNKSIVGQGADGILIGKGLSVRGSKNVIIQNIKIQDINAKYVWGGDAITLDNTDNVWIDHVTTSKIGRQHLVLGTNACGKVTVSNCEFDGQSDYSANCDGYHYWNALFLGSSDQVTFMNNYMHHFSGRAPKVEGNTLFHAVNNYWSDASSTGHGFEIDKGGYVLAEGNVFSGVKNVATNGTGAVISITVSNASQCKASLGRDCQPNSYTNSGTLIGADASVLSKFPKADVPDALAASSVKNAAAGFGKI